MIDAGDLFQRYHLRVFRYFLRLTGDRALAEDLTQDVFVRIVRSAGQYHARDREGAWVFAFVHSVQAEQTRRQGRTPTVLAFGQLPDRSAAPSQVVALGVAQALARLPADEEELLVLRELGGLSYDELSEIFSVSVGSLRNRVYRAREAVRGMLAGWGSERRRAPREERP
jgi:RNA polymerase sigma-70 factor (ECF subfamily)